MFDPATGAWTARTKHAAARAAGWRGWWPTAASTSTAARAGHRRAERRLPRPRRLQPAHRHLDRAQAAGHPLSRGDRRRLRRRRSSTCPAGASARAAPAAPPCTRSTARRCAASEIPGAVGPSNRSGRLPGRCGKQRGPPPRPRMIEDGERRIVRRVDPDPQRAARPVHRARRAGRPLAAVLPGRRARPPPALGLLRLRAGARGCVRRRDSAVSRALLDAAGRHPDRLPERLRRVDRSPSTRWPPGSAPRSASWGSGRRATSRRPASAPRPSPASTGPTSCPPGCAARWSRPPRGRSPRWARASAGRRHHRPGLAGVPSLADSHSRSSPSSSSRTPTTCSGSPSTCCRRGGSAGAVET